MCAVVMAIVVSIEGKCSRSHGPPRAVIAMHAVMCALDKTEKRLFHIIPNRMDQREDDVYLVR
jgi:hypothetical protein